MNCMKSFKFPIIVTFVLGFVAAEQAQPAIEPLVPQNIVTNLLQTYSDKEKELIGKDLRNITETCFSDTTPVAETERVYVATAGGPGACKSTILETYLQDKSNFVYVDPDPRALKFMMNTYYQSLTYYQISQSASYQTLLADAYNKWRNASNYIANTILNDAYCKGYNIAHGMTATSPVINLFFDKLKQRKYKIVLLLCYAPDQTRIQALEHRAQTHAFVQSSSEDAINKGKMFVERFPVYFKYADEIRMYWTQDFLKGSTHAATYSQETGLVTHDHDTMNKFIAKYEADRKDQQVSFDVLVKKC